jgi:alcohol dehydrogenase, propanol-preferring
MLAFALEQFGPIGDTDAPLRLVINAIRKEDVDKETLLGLSYPEQLWMEKEIKSVANVTRRDICSDFLLAAASLGIIPDVEFYDIREANRALQDLKFRGIRGAKVLVIHS